MSLWDVAAIFCAVNVAPVCIVVSTGAGKNIVFDTLDARSKWLREIEREIDRIKMIK